MQQGQAPISCNCIGSLFSPQEKWFLVRKTQGKETQEAPTLHTRNRSYELKPETELKPTKRSLRKRPSSHSNLSNEQKQPQSALLEERRAENDMKISPQLNSPSCAEQYSFSIIDNLLPSSSRGNSPQRFSPTPNHPSPQKLEVRPIHLQQHFFSPQVHSLQERQHPHSQPLLYRRFQSLGNHCQQIGFPPSQFSQLSNVARHSSPIHPEFPPVTQKVHYPVRCPQQETESWMPVREDLMIEEFDRFFKNREQHQSQTYLNVQHRPSKARDTKRSKREKLVGRYAESEDEACSESAHSEVIGKGFESQMHIFWEAQGACQFQDTAATTSTNTKLSELHKVERDGTYRPRFGNEPHFASYKFL